MVRMRHFAVITLAGLLSCGAAHGAEYKLAFAGRKLSAAAGYPSIPGAHKLDMLFTGGTELAANGCTYVTNAGWDLASFTDGTHSLASLEQEGWLVSTVNLSVCTGTTAKTVVSWSGQFTLLHNYPSADYYAYSAIFENPAAQGQYYPGTLYYGVQILHFVNYLLVGVKEDWNPASPGAWRPSELH